MIYNNVVTIAPIAEAGDLYNAISRSIYRGSLRSRKVKTRMHLSGLVNRVYAVAETRGNAVKVFIAYRLDCRSGSKQLFLIIQQACEFLVGLFLRSHPGPEVLYGCIN